MNPLNTIQTQFDVINRGIRGSKKVEVRCECNENPFKSWQDIDRKEFSRGNNLPPGYTQQELDTD
jgi:hypothetical protein